MPNLQARRPKPPGFYFPGPIGPFRGSAMKLPIAALLFVVAMAVAPATMAQANPVDVTDLAALRAAVQADRRAMVASTLALSDAQATKFWPAYDAYQRALDAANRRRVVVVEALLDTDKPISDLHAKNLANELIAADEAEMKARRTMHNRVMRALPAKKAARYFQLENKIRAVQAYDAAAAIPLVK
jgi:Spy/CpxP family protein refolding chaperone